MPKKSRRKPAKTLVKRAEEFASAIPGGAVERIAGSLKEFAFRNPAAFVGVAALTGFTAARAMRAAAHQMPVAGKSRGARHG